MKKVLSSLLALCLCIASLSIGLLASAEQAEPLVWDFVQDEEGWQKATPQATSTNAHDAENGRINISVTGGWGTAGIEKNFTEAIDGSKYEAMKITMAQLASGAATVKEIKGYVGYNNVEDPAYQQEFTVAASGDLFDVTVPLEKDNWKTSQIQDIRVGFAIDAQLTTGNILVIDRVELIPVEEEEPPVVLPAEDQIYSFDAGLEGFERFVPTGHDAVCSIEYDATEKALKGNMLAGWGSIIAQKNFETPFAGSSYKTIKVSIKNTSEKAITALVSFATVDDANIVDQPTSWVKVTVPANMTEYKTFYFQVGENEAWQAAENVNTLRVQLAAEEGQMTIGGTVYVNEVEMLTETENEPQGGDESGTESKPESKPESQPESKPESQPESKPESKPQAKPENLLWGFDKDNDGWEKAFQDENSNIAYKADTKYLHLLIKSNSGKTGIVKNLEEPINGADYGEFKIKMAQGFVAPATASSVKAVKGYIAYTDGDASKLEQEEYREYFTVAALGDLFEVKVPMTKDTWKNGKISTIRIGFDIDGQFVNGSALVFDSIELVTAEKAAQKPTSYKIDFTNSLNGFAVPAFIKTCVAEHVDSSLQIRNMQIGRLIAQGVLAETIDGTTMDKLKIRIKNTSGADSLTISFGTVSDQGANIDNASHQVKVKLNKTNKTDYLEYTVDMSQNSAWKSANDVNIIRLGFYGEGESQLLVGAAVNVRYMNFYNSKAPQTGVQDIMVAVLIVLVVSFGGVVACQTVKRREEK